MEGVILHDDQKQRFSAKQMAPMLNRKSHTISKLKPKIRIIHIFAPEIIKTDATNFRELVQRLTGKPTSEKKTTVIRSPKPNANNTLKGEDQEIWTGSAAADSFSGGGFLGDFADFDGIFMQDLHQTSFLETTTFIN
ncbi:VQ motif-containing protein 25-like [Primulina tabacum]|uniref:VQ motif-containing protein 25-like n=1 Tax=Primulina tabacum TaxID=48773 RepID=UPI003F59FB48